MSYDSFLRSSTGHTERDRNGRAILLTDLLCLKCKIVMSPIAGGQRQCTYCSSREGFSPAEDSEVWRMFKRSIKDALKEWFLDKCCSLTMHFYETYEKNEGFSIFNIPVRTTTLYRTCTNCDKTQRMEWLIFRDVHKIPPARLLDK